MEVIKTLKEKEVKELSIRPLESTCSRCGNLVIVQNIAGKFLPSKCDSCEQKIINVYASPQTGVLIAWVE